MFWANRDSYSLPVGSNASRILAEAALLEVDNYLLSIGVKFCRFVDDYRLFAPNAHKAHYWLTQLIERLWLEGLTINMRKTKIEDVSEKLKTKPEEPEKTKTKDEQKTKTENQDIPEPQFRILAGYGGIMKQSKPVVFYLIGLATLNGCGFSDYGVNLSHRIL